MVLLLINPTSVPAPGKDWMESVTEEETCARIMLTVAKMEKSAVLTAAKRTVLNLVSHYMPLIYVPGRFKFVACHSCVRWTGKWIVYPQMSTRGTVNFEIVHDIASISTKHNFGCQVVSDYNRWLFFQAFYTGIFENSAAICLYRTNVTVILSLLMACIVFE